MRIKEFMCNCDNMVNKSYFSKNIEQYMRIGLKKGDTIYFYAIDPVEDIKDIDNLSWIRDIRHEEYDMISVHWSNGRKLYYQSKVLSDRVIKLDLTDTDVKKIFDNKFKIGTTWANGGIGGNKVGKNDPLFDEDGYEFHNFVVTKDDEVIMDAKLHGGFDIVISKQLVDEVDKECEEERERKKRRWKRIMFPF